MSFTIKDLQALLVDVVASGKVTEDSEVIMATGDPANGGVVYLTVASGFAQREENCPPADTTLFLEIKTVEEVNALITQQLLSESVVEDTLVQ